MLSVGATRRTAASIVGLVALIAAGFTQGAAAEVPDPYAPPPDTIAPIVTISQAPKSMLRTSKPRKRAKFVFESDDPAAIFTCRVDDSPFEPCTSPVTVFLRAGKGKGRRHSFLVRAADAAGNSSGTAVRSLRVARSRGNR